MSLESEEVVEDGESPFLEDQKDCCCPALIRNTARAQGVTCQRLFRSAYIRARYPESVSRAMFALFAREQMLTQHAPIPLAVKDYCNRATILGSPSTTEDRPKEKCFGCSLTNSGLRGVIESYRKIHPEITQETLIAHATKRAVMYSSAYPIEDLSEEDTLLETLLDSGTLEEGNEGWQSMMQWDDVE